MLGRLLTNLRRETPALPLDLFRILAGGLVLVYFVRTFLEVSAFSAPDGVLDHELIREVFWFTKWNLFFPGMSAELFQGIFALGCLGSVAIVVGWRPRTWAFLLSVIVSCTYRWNFPVLYVDDGTMHIVLVWLALLPVGKTLNLADWMREGRGAWQRWCRVQVAGTAVRCFLGNVCLIYLAAGLWKLDSPMWREGTALYAILRTPISHAPDFWGPEHLPLLAVGNYAALVLEPLLAVLLLWPRNSWVRLSGFVGQMAFHAGILATMNVPFANIALMASAVLFFRREVMGWLARGRPVPEARVAPRMGTAGRLSVALLSLICLCQVRGVPYVGEVHKPAFAVLWVAGIGQEYKLFDWIDKVNFHSQNQLFLRDEAGERAVELDPKRIIPDAVRSLPFQLYIQGIAWMNPVSDEGCERLKRSFLERMAHRFAREQDIEGSVELVNSMQRIELGALEVKHPIRRTLLRFWSRDGEAEIRLINVTPVDWDHPRSLAAATR